MFMNFPAVIPNFPPVAFYLIFLWSIIWKGIALWKAAKQDQRNWFIAILILNTVGILEIVYLFYFSKKRLTLNELIQDVQSFFSRK